MLARVVAIPGRVHAEVRVHWFLWRAGRRGYIDLQDGERIPGPDGYPHPLTLNHLRRYACIVTGGCSWGDMRDDGTRRCWKCKHVWANAGSMQAEAMAEHVQWE